MLGTYKSRNEGWVSRFVLAFIVSVAVILAVTPVCESAAAAAKTVPLRIEGDTVVVIKSLPFRIIAPGGADFYMWSTPDSFKTTADDNLLNVTKAPEGKHKVKVVSVTFEFKLVDGKIEKTVKKDSGEIEVVVGKDPGPGPDPDPDPDPDPKDPLVKALQEAYKADTGADKVKHMKGLADLYSKLSTKDLTKFGTYGELFDVIIATSRELLPADAIKAVRAVTNAELKKILPGKDGREQKITEENQQRLKALFVRLASACNQVRLGAWSAKEK
jgi:hypothetical protein